MKIMTRNKITFEGETAKDIVLAMARADFIVSEKWDYMKEVQQRLIILFDKEITIKYGDYDHFLRELMRVDMIKEVK